jgi:DNA-binding transcriptional MocR family regulator
LDWSPQILEGPAPVYVRLADALARDVASGKLPAGTRLPPHRDLAHRLKLGVGTVSKAYGEAERRGVLAGHVGRGSFVTGLTGTAGRRGVDEVLDLARNFPPPAPAERRLREAVSRLRGREDLVEAATYSKVEGLRRTREAGAAWMMDHCGLVSVDADRLIQCNGGQHGLAIALAALCRAGDSILCDSVTFFGMLLIAQHAGYRLHGLPMDGEAMDPDAIADAARRTGARVLYVMPTLHNPTTRTMSAGRRRAIAEVASSSGLTILEDDVYRPYAPAAADLPAFVDLAPNNTFHVTSVSKAICPGLRVGFMLPPPQVHSAALRSAQSAGWSPAALGGMIFAQWIEDGSAKAILDETVAEVRWRTDAARSILGDALKSPPHPASPHLWLPMKMLDAERTAGRALRAGVQVTPVDASLVAPGEESGIRLCIGGIRERASLITALETIHQSIHGEVAGQSVAFI